MGFERFDYLVALVLFGADVTFSRAWRWELLKTADKFGVSVSVQFCVVSGKFARFVFENKHLRNQRFSIAVFGKFACVACLPHRAFSSN